MRNDTELKLAWAARIEDFKKSGLTQGDWCKKNHFTRNQLKYWLYKSDPYSMPSKSSDKNDRWIRVDIPEDAGPVKNDNLILKIGDISIEIGPGYNKKLLADVLSDIRSAC